MTEISPQAIDAWVRSKVDREVERSVILAQVGHLAEFLRYAVEQGDIRANILDSHRIDLPLDYRGHIPGIPNPRRLKPNPVQQARALQEMIARSGCSATSMARELGIPQSAVAKSLALLGLPLHLRDLVEQRRLAPTIAVEIAKHRLPSVQEDLAARVIAGHFRRSDVEEYIRKYPDGPNAAPDRSRCPIVLNGPGEPLIAMGIPRPPIWDRAYAAVHVLAQAWPGRVPLGQLERASDCGGAGATARHHLRKLIALEDAPWWRETISFPGGPWKGYGLTWPPEDAGPEDERGRP